MTEACAFVLEEDKMEFDVTEFVDARPSCGAEAAGLCEQ